MNMRGAAILVCCCRSVLAKVLGEIDREFLDIQQRLCRRPFRVNHVVAFEFDVEEFEFVVFPRLIAGDGRAVDQDLRRHQYAIDQQGVSPRHIEIGMRNIRPESGAGNANRQRVLDPRLRQITPPDWIASDPLDGTEPAEHRRQQIANREVLDLALALSRLNLRSLQETHRTRSAVLPLVVVVLPLVVLPCDCDLCRCKGHGESRRQYGNRLHDVAASSLRARIFLMVRHVSSPSLAQRMPVYRSCQGLIGAVPIGITW